MESDGWPELLFHSASVHYMYYKSLDRHEWKRQLDWLEKAYNHKAVILVLFCFCFGFFFPPEKTRSGLSLMMGTSEPQLTSANCVTEGKSGVLMSSHK